MAPRMVGMYLFVQVRTENGVFTVCVQVRGSENPDHRSRGEAEDMIWNAMGL